MTNDFSKLFAMYDALRDLQQDCLIITGLKEPEILCLEKIIDIFLASTDSPHRVYDISLCQHESSGYILCSCAHCIAIDGTEERYTVYEDAQKYEWCIRVFDAMKEFNKCKFTPNILKILCHIWNTLGIKYLSCSKGQYTAFVVKYSA